MKISKSLLYIVQTVPESLDLNLKQLDDDMLLHSLWLEFRCLKICEACRHVIASKLLIMQKLHFSLKSKRLCISFETSQSEIDKSTILIYNNYFCNFVQQHLTPF